VIEKVDSASFSRCHAERERKPTTVKNTAIAVQAV
jgi:hypothetical protein